jgi:RNA polymerase-binding transcription factor DksA
MRAPGKPAAKSSKAGLPAKTHAAKQPAPFRPGSSKPIGGEPQRPKTKGRKNITIKSPPRKKPGSESESKSPRGSSAHARRKPVTVADAASTAKADAQGYVFINGRRIRMISTKGIPAPKKPRVVAGTQAEQNDEVAAAKLMKTKLGKKELDEYRQLLLHKRAELVGDVSALESQALQSGSGDLSHMPIHMADIGTDTYDQDFMLNLAANERERIREIDAALQRIDDRTYGVCQRTGKPIPKARLVAKPWARETVEAARERERGVGT